MWSFPISFDIAEDLSSTGLVVPEYQASYSEFGVVYPSIVMYGHFLYVLGFFNGSLLSPVCQKIQVINQFFIVLS